jgi:hypothetical protein
MSNEFKDRYVQVFLFFTAGYYRPVTYYHTNNVHNNILTNYFPVISMFFYFPMDLRIINTTISNASSPFAVVTSTNSGPTLFENVTFVNTTTTKGGGETARFFQGTYVKFKNVTIDGLKLQEGISVPHFAFYQDEGAILEIDGITIKNTILNAQKAFSFQPTNYGYLYIKNSNFYNLKLKELNSVIYSTTLKGLKFQNCTFRDISGMTSADIENNIFKIDNIDFDTTNEFEIDSIEVSNSSSTFLHFQQIKKTNEELKYFNISSVKYVDSVIEFPSNLIYYGNLESQVDVKFIMWSLEFTNLIFGRGGNIIKLGHQTKNQIEIYDSKFVDIKDGYLRFESENKQRTDLKTKVKLKNIVVNNMKENQDSFIQVNDGTELEITNITASNVNNFGSGPILAGYQKTTTQIFDSVFLNNTSTKGGVFNVETEAKIVCNN